MFSLDAFLLILILNVTAVVRYNVTKSENFKKDMNVIKELLQRLECFIQGKQ